MINVGEKLNTRKDYLVSSYLQGDSDKYRVTCALHSSIFPMKDENFDFYAKLIFIRIQCVNLTLANAADAK